MTTNLEAAVDGADIVYCAVRAGGMAGRILDETAALAQGVIGQETTGAGGITFALRTVPIVTSIAEVVARRAPDATFVNFTNPVGTRDRGGPAHPGRPGHRDLRRAARPVQAGRRRARPRPPRTSGSTTSGSTTSAGCAASCTAAGTCCPGCSPIPDRLETFEEGRLFGADWLRSVGMIPNEYLYYYYFNAEALEAMQAGRRPLRVPRASSRRRSTPATAPRPRPCATGGGPMPLASRTYMEEAWTGREDDMADDRRGARAGRLRTARPRPRGRASTATATG